MAARAANEPPLLFGNTTAAFGFANRALVAPNLLALERPLLGSFRCDVAIGNASARQFTLIELEDARENSLFEPVAGRDYPRWSSRFERGFSQLVDWAWRIDHERQPSVTLEAAFGTPDPQIHYLLVIGRDRWVGAAGRARLDWRQRHNGISGERTTGVSRNWGYEDGSDMTGRIAAGWEDRGWDGFCGW
jgi:Domain of unknown function (DUF4263)